MADRETLRRENARKDEYARRAGEAYNRALRSEGMEEGEAPPKPKKPSSMMSDIGSRTNPMGDVYKRGGKVKRYAEGGVTEGENKNIDDDTRMRARAAIARRLAGEEDEAPAVKRSVPKAVSKPGPSGRPRDNVAPSGRGAAPGSFRSAAADTAESAVNQIPSAIPPNRKYTPPTPRSDFEQFGANALDALEKAAVPLGIGAGIGAAGVGAKKLYDMYRGAQAAKRANDLATQAATQAAARPRQMLEDMARRQQELKDATARGAADRARLAAKRQAEEDAYDATRASDMEAGFKKGGKVKAYAKGGSVRGDGCAQRGKTKGRFI